MPPIHPRPTIAPSFRFSLVLFGACFCLAAATSCVPTISSVSPNPAEPAQTLTIGGTSFGASQSSVNGQVLYGGQPLEVLTWDNTSITARAPSDKGSGTYPLTVVSAGDSSAPFSHTLISQIELSGVALTVSPENHLAATIRFDTNVAANPGVVVHGPEGDWTVPRTGILSVAPGTHHSVAVVGMRAGGSYSFTVKATYGSFVATDDSLGYSPVPFSQIPNFAAPPIIVTMQDPAALQPGLTLFAATRVGFPGTSRVYAIDSTGNIVWYRQNPPVTPPEPFVPITRVRQLANGNIIYMGSGTREVDLLGNTVHEYTFESMGLDPTVDGPNGHDVIELPNGNLLELFAELRIVSGFPPDAGTLCTTCRVVGDQIIEFTREGQIVDRIHLFDLLDPHRTLLDIHPTLGASFNDASWNWWYGTVGGSTKDWTHCNALVYDASDDSILVSCRHQDVIAKISRATKQLVWVLGSDWPGSSGDDHWPFLRPSGPGVLLPYHQHGPFLKSNGNLLVYDNGNDRLPKQITWQPEYWIDPVAKIVGLAWGWLDPDYSPPLVSFFAGNIEGEPNGNVLITDGSLPSDTTQWMRFSEVRQSDSTKVWEARLQDPSAQYSGLNATRIASLYPPEDLATSSPGAR